jgi:hypothetical protein
MAFILWLVVSYIAGALTGAYVWGKIAKNLK